MVYFELSFNFLKIEIPGFSGKPMVLPVFEGYVGFINVFFDWKLYQRVEKCFFYRMRYNSIDFDEE